MLIQHTKHFQNIMLVGMASKISKNFTYKCVDYSRHNEIRGAEANVHTNQILAHTFSHGTLGNVFVSYSFTILVIALATTVSSLVDKGTFGSIMLQHS